MNNKMVADSIRILYVANADTGTCRSRRKALEALGHRLDLVTFADCCNGWRNLKYKLYAHLLRGPAVSRFNQEILRRARGSACDWVWIDKGILVYPETIEYLRASDIFVVHHLTDDFLNPRHRWYRHYKKALTLYSVHLTSNVYNVQELRDLGVKHAIQTHLGFDPELCRPGGRALRPIEEHRSDVAFIGFWRPHLDAYLAPLGEAGMELGLWGTHWRRSKMRRLLSPRSGFKPVSDADYPRIYAGAKIGLCFLNRQNRNTSTGRSFEIPATGTFMLGERTDEHRDFFSEGIEAEFFDSPEELLDKARFYLAHDDARQRIAEAGLRRALSSGYSYYDRIRTDLEKVIPIYRGDRPSAR